jgi:hypothetical protein
MRAGDKEGSMSDFKAETMTSLRDQSLDELAVYTGSSSPGHWTHLAGMAEFTRRQTEAQLNASAAQIAAAEAEVTAANAATKAADATVKGAAAMERNANYMFWSVIFAAVSAGASALAAIISAFHK